MKKVFHTLAILAAVAALPVATAHAQTTRKPAPKPAVRPAAKPAPAAPARTAAQPAPAPAPAPAKSSSGTSNAGSEPFAVGTNALNIGIGLGSPYSYGGSLLGGSSSVTPALSVSFERGIREIGPGVLGIGVFAGYQGASNTYSGYKDRFTDVIVTVRGAFHYPVTDKFDAYGGVGIGLRHVGYSSDYSGPYSSDYGSTGIASGLFAGGRYFFTDAIGAFGELGYDQTYLKVGLTAKF